jgi:ABC-type transporter Mla MlaB component
VTAAGWLTGAREGGRLRIEAGGAWTLAGLARLDAAGQSLLTSATGAQGQACIDGAALEALDTAGAWLLNHLVQNLQGLGWRVDLAGLRAVHATLLADIRRSIPSRSRRPRKSIPSSGRSPSSAAIPNRPAPKRHGCCRSTARWCGRSPGSWCSRPGCG